MIKSLFFVTLFFTISYANNVYINQLQEEFKEKVIVLNSFKERFAANLTDECINYIQCYQDTIEKLKSWETIKKDPKLNHLISTKSSLLEYDEKYWQNIILKLRTQQIDLNNTQFVSVVDLSKQLYTVTLWDNETKEFYYIGNDFVSTGDIMKEKEVQFGQDHYFKTPAGIFKAISGWRSDGKTGEDNVTKGYGHKGRFIFYFGEQESIRYNTFDKNNQKIHDQDKWQLITDKLQLAFHAHESSKPMGVENSHGCIRMTNELNRFLDNNSILHKNMYDGDKWLHKYSKEADDPKFQNYAGQYLIIFDEI